MIPKEIEINLIHLKEKRKLCQNKTRKIKGFIL